MDEQIGRRRLPNHVVTKISPEPNSGCWLWSASLNTSGYGKVVYEGRLHSAHLLVYRLLIGDVPAGLELDHLCRVRCCVNPTHLEPVTRRENIRRGIVGLVNGNRQKAKTHCPHGHEYSIDNTWLDVKRGQRHCSTCMRKSASKNYHNKKRLKTECQ